MKIPTTAVVISLLCILVMLSVCIGGCTQVDPGTNNSVSTSVDPTETGILPVSQIAESITAQEQVELPITQGKGKKTKTHKIQGPVSVTINSARKMIRFKEFKPYPENILLVLDVSVKNNDLPEGFVFTDRSITIHDPIARSRIKTSLNSHAEIPEILENPIIAPVTINQNDTLNGQVLFGIPDSEKYNLVLVDSNGNEVTVLPILFPPEHVSLTVNSAKTQTNLNNVTSLPGHVLLLLDITVKNNDVHEGFVITDKSVTVTDSKTGYLVGGSLNSNENIRKKLENPIIAPVTIKQNDTLNGQILFGIKGSTDFNVFLIDDDNGNKTILSSRKIHTG